MYSRPLMTGPMSAGIAIVFHIMPMRMPISDVGEIAAVAAAASVNHPPDQIP